MRNDRRNLAIFVPFGTLVRLLWLSIRVPSAPPLALALFTGIESAQYASSAWGSYRAADVNDVLLNFTDAVLVLLFAALVLRLQRSGCRT